jgi:hypothetical protein
MLGKVMIIIQTGREGNGFLGGVLSLNNFDMFAKSPLKGACHSGR